MEQMLHELKESTFNFPSYLNSDEENCEGKGMTVQYIARHHSHEAHIIIHRHAEQTKLLARRQHKNLAGKKHRQI
jgi:hypothetical protein